MYFGFKDITIQYGKKKILENLSVEFPKGKITTIIGKNGCGKSSLLKTVSKAVLPRQGEVIYEGKRLDRYSPKFLAQKIAYLAQVHTSPPDIDVRTLVSYGRYPYSKFGRGLTEKDTVIIDNALERTGLSGLQNQILATLSGGERQRAWIAMTICQEPEILILDEPTTYLDISYQVEVLELIRKLNRGAWHYHHHGAARPESGGAVFGSSVCNQERRGICRRRILACADGKKSGRNF